MMDFVGDILKTVPDDDSTYPEDKLFIYGLVRSLSPEVCVEVGTHRGQTALFISQALRDNGHGHLITCDPIDWGQRDYIQGFHELAKLITCLSCSGDRLEADKIDFLFIDGFHQKGNVLSEINHLFPKLSDHAVVLFHDSGGDVPDSVGVNEAVEESGIKTILLPTKGRMRIYSSFKL